MPNRLHTADRLFGKIVVRIQLAYHQARNGLAAQNMLLQNLFRFLYGADAIPNSFGINDGYRTK
jgi:hypothetical protein